MAQLPERAKDAAQGYLQSAQETASPYVDKAGKKVQAAQGYFTDWYYGGQGAPEEEKTKEKV